MKILIQARPNLFTAFGGDSVQILKTKEYLEELGVLVDISLELEPKLEEYDLIHVFNISDIQDIYMCVKNAKSKGKKVALSTIYVDYSDFEKNARGGIAQVIAKILKPNTIKYLKVLIKAAKNRNFDQRIINLIKNGYSKCLNQVLEDADILLPNSESEMSRINKDFKIKNKKYFPIPNAIDTQLFNYENTIVNKAKEYKDCVLCVARIEGIKCQLNLVRAFKDLPYKLVIIGKASPNQPQYYEKVRKEAGNNVIFLGHISHEELPEYYKVAKVHCLVSWIETTGLASLEAGVMNCNLVITKKGDTEEYFKDYAYYCEPDDINSIREAVIKAYESPIDPNLKNHIEENYTWEKTAEKTLEAYNQILNK